MLRPSVRQRSVASVLTAASIALGVGAPSGLGAAPAPSVSPTPTPSVASGPAGTPTPLPTPALRPAISPWIDGTARALLDPNVVSVTPFPAGEGRLLAKISSYDDRGSDRHSISRTFFAALSEDGTLGRLHEARQDVLDLPQFDDRGRGYAMLSRGASIGWATMTADGQLGTFRKLGRSVMGNPVFAVGPDGDLAFAWTDDNTPRDERATAGTRLRLRVALRPAGSTRFRRTETLPLQPTYDGAALTVAVGAKGRVVVGGAEVPTSPPTSFTVWTGTTRAGLGRRQSVGQLLSHNTVSSAIDAHGLVVIAAGTQGGGEEVSTGYRVRVATRAPGAKRFGALRQVDAGGAKIARTDAVAISPDPRGGALLAWSNDRGDTFDVSTSTVDKGGRISSRRTVARKASFIGLQRSAGGTAALSWSATEDIDRVAFRAPNDAVFGDPEPLPRGVDPLSAPLFWPGSDRLVRSILTPGVTAGAPRNLALAVRSKGVEGSGTDEASAG